MCIFIFIVSINIICLIILEPFWYISYCKITQNRKYFWCVSSCLNILHDFVMWKHSAKLRNSNSEYQCRNTQLFRKESSERYKYMWFIIWWRWTVSKKGKDGFFNKWCWEPLIKNLETLSKLNLSFILYTDII